MLFISLLTSYVNRLIFNDRINIVRFRNTPSNSDDKIINYHIPVIYHLLYTNRLNDSHADYNSLTPTQLRFHSVTSGKKGHTSDCITSCKTNTPGYLL